jgi:hypothetical protein
MAPRLNLSPLTTKQIHDKHAVKEAYCDFWNNIKFKKGWETPTFQRSEVDRLLDEAAEIVVIIEHFNVNRHNSKYLRCAYALTWMNKIPASNLDYAMVLHESICGHWSIQDNIHYPIQKSSPEV